MMIRRVLALIPAILLASLILVSLNTSSIKSFSEDGNLVAASSSELSIKTNSSVAFRESFGYFTDITNEDWMRKKRIAHNRIHVSSGSQAKRVRGYYQSNWNPEFTCGEAVMVHNVGLGGHWICDIWRLNKKGCVVYSIGVNGTTAKHGFAFERALKQKAPLCDIHVFDDIDHTQTAAFTTNTDSFTFHRIGLKGSDGKKYAAAENGGLEFQSIPEMAKAMGHHDKIDYLSLDCEGWEWWLYKDLLMTMMDIRQMALMVHGKYKNTVTGGAKDKTTEVFQYFHDNGYVIFHKEANLADLGKDLEFSYIKLHPSFRNVPPPVLP